MLMLRKSCLKKLNANNQNNLFSLTTFDESVVLLLYNTHSVSAKQYRFAIFKRITEPITIRTTSKHSTVPIVIHKN